MSYLGIVSYTTLIIFAVKYSYFQLSVNSSYNPRPLPAVSVVTPGQQQFTETFRTAVPRLLLHAQMYCRRYMTYYCVGTP